MLAAAYRSTRTSPDDRDDREHHDDDAGDCEVTMPTTKCSSTQAATARISTATTVRPINDLDEDFSFSEALGRTTVMRPSRNCSLPGRTPSASAGGKTERRDVDGC